MLVKGTGYKISGYMVQEYRVQEYKVTVTRCWVIRYKELGTCFRIQGAGYIGYKMRVQGYYIFRNVIHANDNHYIIIQGTGT
jgi:hypothetical protein